MADDPINIGLQIMQNETRAAMTAPKKLSDYPAANRTAMHVVLHEIREAASLLALAAERLLENADPAFVEDVAGRTAAIGELGELYRSALAGDIYKPVFPQAKSPAGLTLRQYLLRRIQLRAGSVGLIMTQQTQKDS